MLEKVFEFQPWFVAQKDDALQLASDFKLGTENHPSDLQKVITTRLIRFTVLPALPPVGRPRDLGRALGSGWARV